MNNKLDIGYIVFVFLHELSSYVHGCLGFAVQFIPETLRIFAENHYAPGR